MIKMTAAEYLKARGWVLMGGTYWADPRHIGAPKHDPGDDGTNVETHAVAVQLARDSAEERSAWVAFAAAETRNPREADKLLDGYRARFAVEIVDEVKP